MELFIVLGVTVSYFAGFFLLWYLLFGMVNLYEFILNRVFSRYFHPLPSPSLGDDDGDLSNTMPVSKQVNCG